MNRNNAAFCVPTTFSHSCKLYMYVFIWSLVHTYFLLFTQPQNPILFFLLPYHPLFSSD